MQSGSHRRFKGQGSRVAWWLLVLSLFRLGLAVDGPPHGEVPASVQRNPGESDTDYFRRWNQAQRAERLRELERVRAEATRDGKEPFEYGKFRQGYLQIKPVAPKDQELEIDYYLHHRSARNLAEYLDQLRQTDLYDGGDMHLERDP